LTAADYLVRQKDGRRYRYQIQAHQAGHVISGYASQVEAAGRLQR
jgi:hypothetical protein